MLIIDAIGRLPAPKKPSTTAVVMAVVVIAIALILKVIYP